MDAEHIKQFELRNDRFKIDSNYGPIFNIEIKIIIFKIV
jgi:hypothetical protein